MIATAIRQEFFMNRSINFPQQLKTGTPARESGECRIVFPGVSPKQSQVKYREDQLF
jgi:hypothetical protein